MRTMRAINIQYMDQEIPKKLQFLYSEIAKMVDRYYEKQSYFYSQSSLKKSGMWNVDGGFS